jgi:hypothetical protein
MKNWGFCGGSYTGYASASAAEECINLFTETVKLPSARAQTNLINVPGKQSFGTLSTGLGGAIYEQDGRCFTVSSLGAFDEVFADGTVTNRGTVSISSRPPFMVGNGSRGHQVLIISGGGGSVFNTSTNTLTAITHASFPSDAITGGFIDGYGIAVSNDRFVLSALFDFTTWDNGTGQRRRRGQHHRGALRSRAPVAVRRSADRNLVRLRRGLVSVCAGAWGLCRRRPRRPVRADPARRLALLAGAG